MAFSISSLVAISSIWMIFWGWGSWSLTAILFTIFSDVPRMRTFLKIWFWSARAIVSRWTFSSKRATRTAARKVASRFAECPATILSSLIRSPSSMMSSMPYFCARSFARKLFPVRFRRQARVYLYSFKKPVDVTDAHHGLSSIRPRAQAPQVIPRRSSSAIRRAKRSGIGAKSRLGSPCGPIERKGQLAGMEVIRAVLAPRAPIPGVAAQGMPMKRRLYPDLMLPSGDDAITNEGVGMGPVPGRGLRGGQRSPLPFPPHPCRSRSPPHGAHLRRFEIVLLELMPADRLRKPVCAR